MLAEVPDELLAPVLRVVGSLLEVGVGRDHPSINGPGMVER